MRAVIALALMAASAAVFGAPKQVAIYSCDWASGHDVLDLACNIYFEAGHEPTAGKFLVAHTVFNRMASKHYPDSISEVVYEKRRDKRTGKIVPMFSWTLDGKADVVYNVKAWTQSLVIAAKMVHSPNDHADMSLGAMWYHADYVEPYWAESYYRTVQVGRHIFYSSSPKTAQRVLSHIMGAS